MDQKLIYILNLILKYVALEIYYIYQILLLSIFV